MDISILIKEHYISLKSYTTWIIQNKLNWDLYPEAIPSHILFFLPSVQTGLTTVDFLYLF